MLFRSKLPISYLSLVCFAASAFHSTAAELESVERQRVEISARQSMLPATKPTERRNLDIKVLNLLRGPDVNQFVDIAVYWIGAGTPRTVLAVNHSPRLVGKLGANIGFNDSGPQAAKIEG